MKKLKKIKTSLLLTSLALFLARIFLLNVNYEFRWIWLNIMSEIALPIYLLTAFLTLTCKLKSKALRIFVCFAIVAGSIFLGGIYFFWRGTSAEHTFHSSTGKNTLIVKEWSLLLSGSIDFYEPRYVILKKHFLPAYDGTDDGYMPFSDGQYTINWIESENECIVSWDFDYLPAPQNKDWKTRIIQFQ